MPPEIIGVLVQVPVVAAFVVFVLQQMKTQQQSIRDNHHEWQVWLKAQNEQWQKWIGEQNRIFLEAMAQDGDRESAERRELAETMRHLDGSIERQTTITLLVYATLRGSGDRARSLENDLVKDLSER